MCWPDWTLNLGKESNDIDIMLKESKDRGTNCDLEMLRTADICIDKDTNVRN